MGQNVCKEGWQDRGEEEEMNPTNTKKLKRLMELYNPVSNKTQTQKELDEYAKLYWYFERIIDDHEKIRELMV